jgi:hypothetical protein
MESLIKLESKIKYRQYICKFYKLIQNNEDKSYIIINIQNFANNQLKNLSSNNIHIKQFYTNLSNIYGELRGHGAEPSSYFNKLQLYIDFELEEINNFFIFLGNIVEYMKM